MDNINMEHLRKQRIYFEKEINKLEKEIGKEEMTIAINDGKTLCANPKIKILNDYTKNHLAIVDRIHKIEGVADSGTSELEKHISRKDK